MTVKKLSKLTFFVFAFFPAFIIFIFTYKFTASHFISSEYKFLKRSVDLFSKSLTLAVDKADTAPVQTPENLSDYFFSEFSYPGTERVFLLGKDEAIIYHSRNITISEILSDESAFFPLLEDYKNNTLAPDSYDIYKSQDKKYINVYQTIPDQNMLLVISKKIPQHDFVTKIILPSALLSVLALLPCFLLFGLYIKKSYAKPIMELRDSMRTAALGNLKVRSKVQLKNELGEFSEHFNQMMNVIKHNYDELSIMHKKLKDNEERLRSTHTRTEYLAYHDVLTQLPNKLNFYDRLNSVLSGSLLQVDKHAVYFVDLDNFKIINDTLGHDYGDLLLVQTAEALQKLLSDKDCIARAGGDEFLIFKPYLHSHEEAIMLAEAIINEFKKPMELNGESVYVSMSIGIAMYPDNGLDSNILIKSADIAMYSSKETGKDKYTLFNKKMEDELHNNALILEVLRHAIENGELFVQYQPQVSLTKNQIVGFEALMRLHNPRLGLVSPADFIPIAEESGLINQLGEWVLRESCILNKKLLDSGITPCTVSVNISSVQINRLDFFDMLSRILEETGLPPEYLELELTESSLVSSVFDTAILLDNLRKIGVKVALDDFGTGYSSLSYLAKMNINTLKIDKSFIDNICTSERELSLVDTIIRLAHHLGIQVVAEGAEYESQLALLREMKCDTVQGFIYSKPLLKEDLINVLEHIKIYVPIQNHPRT